MIWTFLAPVFLITFGIAGALYPKKRKILWILGICSVIFAIILAIYQSVHQSATSAEIAELSDKMDKQFSNTKEVASGNKEKIPPPAKGEFSFYRNAELNTDEDFQKAVDKLSYFLATPDKELLSPVLFRVEIVHKATGRKEARNNMAPEDVVKLLRAYQNTDRRPITIDLELETVVPVRDLEGRIAFYTAGLMRQRETQTISVGWHVKTSRLVHKDTNEFKGMLVKFWPMERLFNSWVVGVPLSEKQAIGAAYSENMESKLKIPSPPYELWSHPKYSELFVVGGGNEIGDGQVICLFLNKMPSSLFLGNLQEGLQSFPIQEIQGDWHRYKNM